jgi:hypothetical protein
MKNTLVALMLTLIAAGAAHAQRGGGRYATPFAHIAVGTPLSNSANSYNTGIHGDLGVEIGSATAVSRLGWRATIGFNHFGAKPVSNGQTNGKLDITSGNADLVLALHPASSAIGVYTVAGAGFYQHKVKESVSGVSLDRTTNNVGVEGGLTLRLLQKHVSPEIESRAHVVFASGEKITYLTVGIGVVVNRRGQRR